MAAFWWVLVSTKDQICLAVPFHKYRKSEICVTLFCVAWLRWVFTLYKILIEFIWSFNIELWTCWSFTNSPSAMRGKYLSGYVYFVICTFKCEFPLSKMVADFEPNRQLLYKKKNINWLDSEWSITREIDQVRCIPPKSRSNEIGILV